MSFHVVESLSNMWWKIKSYLNQNLSYIKTTAFALVISLCYFPYLKVFIFSSGCLKTRAGWKLAKQQFNNKNGPNIKLLQN